MEISPPSFDTHCINFPRIFFRIVCTLPGTSRHVTNIYVAYSMCFLKKSQLIVIIRVIIKTFFHRIFMSLPSSNFSHSGISSPAFFCTTMGSLGPLSIPSKNHFRGIKKILPSTEIKPASNTRKTTPCTGFIADEFWTESIEKVKAFYMLCGFALSIFNTRLNNLNSCTLREM